MLRSLWQIDFITAAGTSRLLSVGDGIAEVEVDCVSGYGLKRMFLQMRAHGPNSFYKAGDEATAALVIQEAANYGLPSVAGRIETFPVAKNTGGTWTGLTEYLAFYILPNSTVRIRLYNFGIVPVG